MPSKFFENDNLHIILCLNMLVMLVKNSFQVNKPIFENSLDTSVISFVNSLHRPAMKQHTSAVEGRVKPKLFSKTLIQRQCTFILELHLLSVPINKYIPLD